MAVAQLEEGRAEVENQYSRAVRREGNRSAQQRIAEVFRGRPSQAGAASARFRPAECGCASDIGHSTRS